MEIISQVPGVFYRRPNPDSPRFVEEGQPVEDSTVVGLIEIMKNFYEVQAGMGGRLLRFMVKDGDVVDVGQVLAEVEIEE